MKIALAMIIKGDDKEAELLDRCLENVSPYVDGIFLSVSHKKGEAPNQKVANVGAKYRANVSDFVWKNDFAYARNFNFSHVPKEYDYILWCDADDVFRGLENLRQIIEENPSVDAFAFNYLYDFDNYKNPIVVHKKTQVVRNDGCVEWVGKLHEDFRETRSLTVKFVDKLIERMHFTNDERVLVNFKRNIEISQEEVKLKPNDPRSYFNLANSYFGANKLVKAKAAYLKFLKTSESPEEKYIAHQRLSAVEQKLGNKDSAVEHLQIALGMYPEIPDTYHLLGYLMFENNQLDEAERYLLLGLVMKPKYHKMIVYNPRDYDYNPMMALAKVYFNKHRPDYALPMLKGCLQIYPDDQNIKGLVEEMEKELRRVEKVIEAVKYMETLGDDKNKILAEIEKLSPELQSHPAICRIRNKFFVKTESTGKDIAYYCGETKHEWNPEMAKTKGIGGSEEAVINLSKEWVKLGYNVTVFNSCGTMPMVCDGVTYKPYWHFNAQDKYDYLIAWRSPRLVDHNINASKIFIDLHDVVSAGEFNEKRLKKIDKVMVKTKAHRDLFPNVPDEKISIIPNGQDFKLFDKETKKNEYLLVNTSSPDRSMDVLPKLFMKVKKRVPMARLKWAYGWEIFDNTFSNDRKMMDWKERVQKEMEVAGIENMGRLSQEECAKLYLEGRILAYPTEFFEIDCISVKKAQACGCMPITTDFAALEESNQFGVKVHSKKTKDDWNKPYQFHFGIEDEETQNKWVEAVVDELLSPLPDTAKMKEWARKFSWDLIADNWIKILCL